MARDSKENEAQTRGLSRTGQSRLTAVAGGARICARVLGLIVPMGLRALRLRFSALVHRFTYKAVDAPKSVVILGGSFAGIQVAKWLAEAVPTGYRVVLVERNSHFHYLFAFPRYSVVAGYERGAFIPYDAILAGEKRHGSLLHVRGTASSVTPRQVLLSDGQAIDYSYLVVATGSSQPPPAKLVSTDREAACGELRDVQTRIAQAASVAVLGSGAVGVEIAADIKTYFPDKQVTLFSSRDSVLPQFGRKLQEHVADVLDKVGVNLRLGLRPKVLPGDKSLELPDGTVEEYDVVLRCTGQKPNSDILRSYLPESISPETGRILVTPTLQVQDAAGSGLSHVFALGDVAEHGGPRMARAVYMQAGVVRDNILQLVRGRQPSHQYRPKYWLEGAIQLTVGKDTSVSYFPDEDGKDMVFSGSRYPDDFRISHGWKLVGARYPGPEKDE